MIKEEWETLSQKEKYEALNFTTKGMHYSDALYALIVINDELKCSVIEQGIYNAYKAITGLNYDVNMLLAFGVNNSINK